MNLLIIMKIIKMKNILLTLTFLVSFLSSIAQDKQIETVSSSSAIPVSDIKTTHFIFKDKIEYIDLGSRYFITDTIKNIVKVKHIGSGYTVKSEEKSTNLTIITTGGDFYSIPIFYQQEIKNTTYKFGYATNNITKMANPEKDDTALFEMCHFAKTAPSNNDIKGNRDLILAKVNGIFYRDDYMSIRLVVKNFSTIDLDIDHFLFRFVKNTRFAKDAVYQERVLRPDKICNETLKVKGTGGIEIFNFVFRKFTPNVDEDLELEVFELSGGRSTTIKIPRKKLLKPKVI